MPGYYDWKIRNCPAGAISKAGSFNDTVDFVEPELERLWEAQGGKFTDEQNAKLASVIKKIDKAEDCLESAKLELAAAFLPGAP